MTILEKKVDTLIRLCLSDNPLEQDRCKQKLRDLLSGKTVVGTIREEAAALLTEIGVSSHLLGYNYALDAICIAVDNQDAAVRGNTVALYQRIAEQYAVTWRNVERCIRHAVERCFDNTDPDLILQYFGGIVSPDKGKLTCGEFVAECGKIIRNKINNTN